MYTRRERGQEAAWLREMRKARWSNARVAVEEFGRLSGVPIQYSRWAAYESGAKPIRDDHMDAFVAFFGQEPARDTPAGDDLASAIREQARALDRLVAALDRQQQEPPPWADALARALGVRLTGSGNEASGGLPASAVPQPGRV